MWRPWLAAALVVWVGPLAAQQVVTSLPCRPGQGGFEVPGVVADMLSAAPLPGALVYLLAADAFPPPTLGVAEADEEGRFVFCATVPPEPEWRLVAELDTLQSRPVPLGDGSTVDTVYIRWSEPATLSGTVRRVQGGGAVSGARVVVEGRGVRVLTDDSGRFRLRGLGAGRLVLTTTSLGLAPRTDSVFVPAGGSLAVDIVLGEEAIELPPLTVSAAPAGETSGVRFFGISQARIDELVPRVPDLATLVDLGNAPGLSAYNEIGAGRVCIEFLRRSRAGCAMVAVFVNGAYTPEPGSYLASLPLTAIREIRVYAPIDAQFRFSAPNIGNGAIDVILR